MHKSRTSCFQCLGTWVPALFQNTVRLGMQPFPTDVFLNLNPSPSSVEIFPSASDMTGQQAPLEHQQLLGCCDICLGSSPRSPFQLPLTKEWCGVATALGTSLAWKAQAWPRGLSAAQWVYLAASWNKEEVATRFVLDYCRAVVELFLGFSTMAMKC